VSNIQISNLMLSLMRILLMTGTILIALFIRVYRNVIARFGDPTAELILVGAHYDA